MLALRAREFVVLATVMEAMMAPDAIEDDLSRRFRIDPPPTLLARKSSKERIVFSRMRSNHPMRGRSLATPPQGRLFHFMFRWRCRFSRTYGRKEGVERCPIGVSAMHSWLTSATVRSSGWIPLSGFASASTSRRLRLMRWPMRPEFPGQKGLYAPDADFGARDLIMFGLAQALAGAMERPGDGTAMFSDSIALAFFAHIVRAYGSVPIGDETPTARACGVASVETRPRPHQCQSSTRSFHRRDSA